MGRYDLFESILKSSFGLLIMHIKEELLHSTYLTISNSLQLEEMTEKFESGKSEHEN